MADSSVQLSIYIPATLAESAPHASSHFASLESLLARADTTRGDSQLLTLFGADVSGGAAYAALSHYGRYGQADFEAWRVIASPVHMAADHATLHLPPQHAIALSDAESRALMASCQDYFAGEGWQFEYGDAKTWYLQMTAATAITTTPLADAVGASLFEALPQGSDARLWRRWLNEVQMLLHTHGVNEARQERGEAPLNSLWIWGEGHMPRLSEKRFMRVFGGDAYVQGLARLSGAQWAPLPEEGLSALDNAVLQEPLLVVLDAATASDWESQWFCGLAKQLRDKAVQAVTLHFANGYTTLLTRSMLWRFWRRKKFSLSLRESTP